MTIAENVVRLRERIAAAAQHAGRGPRTIRLMAVTKTQPPELIREAIAAGIDLFGENRVQEFSEKQTALRGAGAAEWRFIGHLQSNKAAQAAELFNAVDSVGSLRLAEKLNIAAEKLHKRLSVLIEINIGGEAAKSGLAPDSGELDELLAAAPRLSQLEVRGLMTVPPFTEDPEGARPYFRRLRELWDEITSRHLPAVEMEELSMGMSHDFEIAIAEGSTCVRLGTALFGSRQAK